MDKRLYRVTARFIYISDERSRSQWHDVPAADIRVTWRVVAGNNRPLGRSARVFPSLTDCVEAATRLHREIGRAGAGRAAPAGSQRTAGLRRAGRDRRGGAGSARPGIAGGAYGVPAQPNRPCT